MAPQRSTQLPAGLARVPLRTVRAQHANDIYAYPGQELARLTDRGLLHRVAKGFYVVVAQDMVGREWRPNLEATAVGIASAVYGPANAVLMGVSAARAHGAIPRAVATAVVAVPDQHRAITLIDRPALVRFVKRDTKILDAERIETSLGPALVTSPEQTVLDLAHRPGLGDAEVEVASAVTVLYPRCDKQRLKMLAADQRRMASLRRAELWARAT
ncbi:MAG: type IV toxin-antitoxin system AbiEi family antitoxin [Mycobacterium sp.]|uniref:type IV toxin-antitoxin system AbiEi family antitoxin domain-containing protein n=1 Tax=Mycobacterium sp. TaxID=1785 RepID=UPI003CC59EA4